MRTGLRHRERWYEKTVAGVRLRDEAGSDVGHTELRTGLRHRERTMGRKDSGAGVR